MNASSLIRIKHGGFDTQSKPCVQLILDDESLKGACSEEPRIASEPATSVTSLVSEGSEIYKQLHLAHTDRLGIAAQVGGSSIKASVITRDPNDQQYVQKNFQIANDNGRGVHVLFDLFAMLAKVAMNAANVVANISWAGSHLGDLGERDAKGKWKHSNFDVERFQDSKSRHPIPIDKLMRHKLATGQGREGETYDRTLIVKNGMSHREAINRGQSGRTFELNIFHDPHASIVHGARSSSTLQEGDNLGVLIGGTGNNIWLGENWDTQNQEFRKYHQTRFGLRPNMFALDTQVDDIKILEPFRFEAWQNSIKFGFQKSPSLNKAEVADLYDFYGRPELWFTGGRNSDPNSGIKATFNYIRHLVNRATGNIATADITAAEAKEKLKLVFDKLNIPDAEQARLCNDVVHDPILRSDLDETSWVKTVIDNKDHILVKSVMSNLLQRFTEVIGVVLREYSSVITRLKGFIIHGGFIRSLLSEEGHGLHSSFVDGLNRGLALSGPNKLSDQAVVMHDPPMDGAYKFTLDDLARQDRLMN